MTSGLSDIEPLRLDRPASIPIAVREIYTHIKSHKITMTQANNSPFIMIFSFIFTNFVCKKQPQNLFIM